MADNIGCLAAIRPDVCVLANNHILDFGVDALADTQRTLARRSIDAGIDVVHGHSSHHPRPIEVYRGKLILYGCGDLVKDYEGIGGYARYRDELRLLYLAEFDTSGTSAPTSRSTPRAPSPQVHHERPSAQPKYRAEVCCTSIGLAGRRRIEIGRPTDARLAQRPDADTHQLRHAPDDPHDPRPAKLDRETNSQVDFLRRAFLSESRKCYLPAWAGLGSCEDAN